MEKVIFQQDIPTLRVAATSFPAGIMQAYGKLHGVLPVQEGRQSYGISTGDAHGNVLYWAATNILDEQDQEKSGFEPFTIRKGAYASILVKDFDQDIPVVGRTFETLLTHPELDPEGYCLEIYLNDHDVQCLVKLKD